MKAQSSRRIWVIAAIRIAAAVFVLLGLAGIPLQTARANDILYVKPDGLGGLDEGTCSVWDRACDLHYALSIAVEPDDELWVMKGIYYPTGAQNGTDRSATFSLKSGVVIYGGFVGTETARTQRNWVAHETILSGNIHSLFSSADNSYHVVTASGVGSTALLDGFTIHYGYASGGDLNSSGAGIYINNASPTLKNLIISGNHAVISGGGVANFEGSSPHLSYITITNNSADSGGGGMYNTESDPVLDNVVFSENDANYGGGMQNSTSNPVMTYVTFDTNTADTDGGGIFNASSAPVITDACFHNNSAGNGGGGIRNGASNLELTNVTFYQNDASVGGGILNFSSSLSTFLQVTLNGNTASLRGSGIYNYDSSPTITNSILWGNTDPENVPFYNDSSAPVVTYSDIEGGYGDADDHNIDLDPIFYTPVTYGNVMLVLPLLPGSPAINAGTNTGCPDHDVRSVTRPQGIACDMGAYETRNFTLTILNGNFQSVYILNQFTSPLSVTVTGVSEDPVNGGMVYFDTPLTGPSAEPAFETATISGGQAEMTFTANGFPGSYNVYFNTIGMAARAQFSLTNVILPGAKFIYLPLLSR